VYVKPENAHKPELYKDGSVNLEKVEEDNGEEELAEWIAHHHKDYGCELEFITDKSPEGTQFVKGFGGFGGFLRYKVDLESQEVEFTEDDDDNFM
jgi:peptide chain release factor subunit 1